MSLAVEREAPDECRPEPAGQQAGRVLGQHRGVQRDPPLGRVEGLAAMHRLGVDRSAGWHEGRNVSDGVVHVVSAVHPDQVHRLVEIHRSGRIDGDERDARQIEIRQLRGPGGTGGREHLGGEFLRHAQLGAGLLEPAGKGRRLRAPGVRQTDATPHHESAP